MKIKEILDAQKKMSEKTRTNYLESLGEREPVIPAATRPKLSSPDVLSRPRY